ncbi:MAG: signal peptidase II [Peptostreptococcales bacterium]
MIYLLVLVLISIDQVSKYIITTNLMVYDSIPLIQNFFHITYVKNYGAAFSILQNKRIFFVSITIAVSIGIILFMVRYSHDMSIALKVSLGLILAGAIGNLIDRIRLGYVVDFLDFRVFPIFNVADICVVCGSILLIFYMFFIEPKLKKNL